MEQMERRDPAQQQTYDLSGLTFIYTGAILCVAVGLTGIGLLAGALLSIAGAFRLKDAAYGFRRSGYHAVLLTILAGLIVRELFNSAVQGTDMMNGPSFIMVAGYLFYLGYYWWSILVGCGEIAASRGNEALQGQCRYARGCFLVAIAVILVALRFGNVVSFKTPIQLSHLGQNFSVLFLPLWALLLASIIFAAVAMRKTRILYQGTPKEE